MNNALILSNSGLHNIIPQTLYNISINLHRVWKTKNGKIVKLPNFSKLCTQLNGNYDRHTKWLLIYRARHLRWWGFNYWCIAYIPRVASSSVKFCRVSEVWLTTNTSKTMSNWFTFTYASAYTGSEKPVSWLTWTVHRRH